MWRGGRWCTLKCEWWGWVSHHSWITLLINQCLLMAIRICIQLIQNWSKDYLLIQCISIYIINIAITTRDLEVIFPLTRSFWWSHVQDSWVQSLILQADGFLETICIDHYNLGFKTTILISLYMSSWGFFISVKRSFSCISRNTFVIWKNDLGAVFQSVFEVFTCFEGLLHYFRSKFSKIFGRSEFWKPCLVVKNNSTCSLWGHVDTMMMSSVYSWCSFCIYIQYMLLSCILSFLACAIVDVLINQAFHAFWWAG